jgi:hypothetical protein
MVHFDPSRSLIAGLSVVTLRQWLSDAQTALHLFIIGRREEIVNYDGRGITYSRASRADLEAHIQLLQMQLGMTKTRRALRVYFR